MRAIASFALLAAVLASRLVAQPKPALANSPVPYEIKISSGVAEKLLIHKVEQDACPHVAVAAHVTGTVVVGFSIDRNGNVRYPQIISGPRMLQKPVLDAVRKYKYKPYLLNGRAVEVETTVAVTIDNVRDCHLQ